MIRYLFRTQDTASVFPMIFFNIKMSFSISFKLYLGLVLAVLLGISPCIGFASSQTEGLDVQEGQEELPTLNDPNLKVRLISDGLKFPTSMAFLGPDDILVLEKNEGTVRRIISGQLLEEPLLDLNVANAGERGLLGIAIAANRNEHNENIVHVFLYLTKTESADGDDDTEEAEPAGNQLYRYELVNNQLVNPKLLLDLPAMPGPNHNGGAISIGPDNNVYVPIGDVYITVNNAVGLPETEAQNVKDGAQPTGTGGILAITQEGYPIDDSKGGLGEGYPLSSYYAFGIRNSFGLDFDPLSGTLWDTENGPYYGDEINRVEPGFNSGWAKVQGMAPSDFNEEEELVSLGTKGGYSDPEFELKRADGITALKFLNSHKYGSGYQNDMFVGIFNYGDLYHFELTEDRMELSLDGPLSDQIADEPEELEAVSFGQNFGPIVDIEVGPDGYLYVLSLHKGIDQSEAEFLDNNGIEYASTELEGSIFRIE
jgi:glucose/arabinose dehydrogenase